MARHRCGTSLYPCIRATATEVQLFRRLPGLVEGRRWRGIEASRWGRLVVEEKEDMPQGFDLLLESLLKGGVVKKDMSSEF